VLQTAFIVIPQDVSHGQALRCSHPICRNRGVRFRFCAACQRPVAKRNFSSRHNHPQEDFPKTEEEKEAEAAKSAQEEPETVPSEDEPGTDQPDATASSFSNVKVESEEEASADDYSTE
jgi:hypothetical protein